MNANPPEQPGWTNAARMAVLIGGTAGAFAAFGSPMLTIESPGALPLVILGIVLLVARPGLNGNTPVPMHRWTLALLTLGFVIPFAGAFGFAPEREAALLASPRWVFVWGVLILGVAFRGAALSVVGVTFAAIAGLRIWGAWQSGLDWVEEATWWIPSLVWVAGVAATIRLASRKSLPEAAPLLAAMSWFVLVLVTMTLQESRHPTPHFFGKDRDAMVAAMVQRPATGWGLGSSERVFLETAQRDPRMEPLAARAVMRLAAEVGVVPLLLLMGAGLTIAARELRQSEWNGARIVSLGVGGFFLVAVISSRGDWSASLAVLAFCFAVTFAPARDAPAPAKPLLRLAVCGAIPCLAIAILFLGARMHYENQDHRQPPGPRSFLPTWTVPLREQALFVREQPELDVDRLEAIARRWIAAAPHDEYAWVEWVRIVHNAEGPQAAEPIAREATRRLPWSDTMAAWLRRILVEENRHREALEFLEMLREKRGSLPPALHRRLLELRIQLRESRSDAP